MMKPVDEMKIIAKSWMQNDHRHVEIEYDRKDVFGWNDKGKSTEVEIKVADYDFYKEFQRKSKVKKHLHYVQGINAPTFFYFFVLSNFTQRALKCIDDLELPYGLLEYNTLKKKITIIRIARRLK